MGQFFDEVVQFFQTEGWTTYPVDGQPILELNYQGRNGRWVCYAHAREDQRQLLFYSVCQATASADARPNMAEYLTRANWGLCMGNFEMDWDDGEIRFKTSLDVDSESLTPVLIKQVIYSNLYTMDKYLPGIMTVRYGDTPPAEAVAQIESEGV